MGINLRFNEKKIKYSIPKNILSGELKSLNDIEQKNMININYEISKKDVKKKKYNKTNDKNSIYINTNKKNILNF